MAKKNNKTKESLLKKILSGKVINISFFIRHWYYVFGALILIMIYIACKYTVQSELETIRKLQKERDNALTERIKESSQYNTNIREPRMRQHLDTLHIDLYSPDQPPYKL